MRPIRVLIVEDEQEHLERYNLACRERGFARDNIRTVSNKASALASLEGWEPDMVILDLGIPATATAGDPDKRYGRDVLLRIGEINRTSLARMAVMIISGRVADDYEEQQYRDLPFCVGVYNKDSVSDILPKLIKRAEKFAMPVYRELKVHAPGQMLALFERIMSEDSEPEQVLIAAHELANAITRNIGERILGAYYPLSPASDHLYNRTELLRGAAAKLQNDYRLSDRATTENWVLGLPYQHLQAIRNYWNTYKHERRVFITGSEADRCLLDPDNAGDRAVIESLERMDRVPEIIRPIVVDLLEWYLPWARRQQTAGRSS